VGLGRKSSEKSFARFLRSAYRGGRQGIAFRFVSLSFSVAVSHTNDGLDCLIILSAAVRGARSLSDLLDIPAEIAGREARAV
jgi:hypothetical protein